MKFFKILLLSICVICQSAFADDGKRQMFTHVEMNINQDNYVLFEDNSLIICDRYTDEYMVEITEDFDLFIKGKKISVNDYQRELIEDYYMAQYNLFSSRNIIGAKGIEIGMESASLAIKAVGGAFVLIASGFDEQAEEEFEKEMEDEAEKIEEKAEELEKEADEYEHYVYLANRIERKIRFEIEELEDIDLYVDKDALSISVD